ncbi:hypothetical protein ADUPG1_005983, partial [Aduncisulcus paluster]
MHCFGIIALFVDVFRVSFIRLRQYCVGDTSQESNSEIDEKCSLLDHDPQPSDNIPDSTDNSRPESEIVSIVSESKQIIISKSDDKPSFYILSSFTDIHHILRVCLLSIIYTSANYSYVLALPHLSTTLCSAITQLSPVLILIYRFIIKDQNIGTGEIRGSVIMTVATILLVVLVPQPNVDASESPIESQLLGVMFCVLSLILNTLFRVIYDYWYPSRSVLWSIEFLGEFGFWTLVVSGMGFTVVSSLLFDAMFGRVSCIWWRWILIVILSFGVLIGIIDVAAAQVLCAARMWTEDDVSVWLECIKYSQYIQIFKDNNISGKELLYCTEDDLLDMGIDSFGDRKGIVWEITHLLDWTG